MKSMRSKSVFIFILLVVFSLLFSIVLSQECAWPEQKCVGDDKYQCNDFGQWEYFSTCPSGTVCKMQTPTSIYAVCEEITTTCSNRGGNCLYRAICDAEPDLKCVASLDCTHPNCCCVEINITTTTTTTIPLTTTPGLTTASTTTTTIPPITEEHTRLDTTNNRIIIGEALNNARTLLNKTDLPTLLADGEVTDDSGVFYPYTQDIQLNGNAHVYYSRSDYNLIDPVLHIEMVPTSGSPTYTTRVIFYNSLPVSSPDVIYNTINLFGKDYVIGSGSDYNTLILYGESNTILLNEGESTTIKFGGVEYTVGVGGVSGTTTAVVSVNGVSESMTQGSTKKISGLDVYLAAVYYYPKEGQVSQAKVSLGSQKITLENGDEVFLGMSDYINNTFVTITGTLSNNEISSFAISTPAQNSYNDDIEIGESYIDPVWKTFNLKFLSTSPSLNSPTNDFISISGSSDTASIKFTDYSGIEKTIPFAYDNNTASGIVTPHLMDWNSYKIHIKEGDRVYYKDYVVINKGDDTHLLQLTNVPSGSIKTTDTVRFSDVFAGDVIMGRLIASNEIGANSCEGGVGANISMLIWTQDFNIMVCNASTKTDSYVEITWDDTDFYSGDTGAGYGIPGYITFLPGIKGRNGEYVHFVNSYTKFSDGDVVILPGSKTDNTHTVDSSSSKTFKVGQIEYTYDHTKETIVPTQLKNYTVGIMILEEKRFDNTQHAIYIGVTETGSTTKTVKVAQPSFSDTTSTRDGSGGVEYTDWGSNSYIKSAIDAYGTLVTYNSHNEAGAIITYPHHQLYNDIIILKTEAPVETTSTTTIQLLCTNIGGFCTVNSVCLKNDGICYDGYPDCGQDYCCCIVSGTTTTTVETTTTTLPPDVNCSDNDGGIDSRVYGCCQDSTGTYCDYCSDYNIVKEYYCSSTTGKCEAATHRCAILYGSDWICLGGKCVESTTTQTCSGNVNLTLSPNPVEISSNVHAKVRGTYYCGSLPKKDSCYGEIACESGAGCGQLSGGENICDCDFTSSSVPGNYTYYACVDKNNDTDYNDPGESDSETLVVTEKTIPECPGDLNGDWRVSITDLTIIGMAYGSRPEDSNWSLLADVDGSEKIDIFDLVYVARNYGNIC